MKKLKYIYMQNREMHVSDGFEVFGIRQYEASLRESTERVNFDRILV